MTNQLIIFSAQYLHFAIVGIGIGFVAFALSKKHRNNAAALGVLSLIVGFILDKVSNHFIYNPRPFVVENIAPLFPHIADNGFPSEHTLLAMIVAGTVLMYHRKLGVLLVLLAFWVGLARVLSKVHHLTDVLGSVAIAIIAVAVSWYFLRKLSKITPIKPLRD